MAHNPERRLNKIEKVQRIHLLHAKAGIPGTRIFKDYIEDNFDIGYRTYTSFLSVNVALERKKLLKMQLAKSKGENDHAHNDQPQDGGLHTV